MLRMCEWREAAYFLIKANVRDVAEVNASGPRADIEAGVVRNHLGKDVQYRLGHGAIVNLDEVARSRVHLQTFIECQCRFDLLGSWTKG
jgi:hypothetical protein